jgi:hypothetical protein
MSLYHSQIGLPKNVEWFFGRSYLLTYSRHAQLSCLNDRYGVIRKPPFQAQVTRENIIEVETQGNLIIKIVIRVSYDERFDVVIALIPDFDIATVKTIWLNEKNDFHKTLDKSKYVC